MTFNQRKFGFLSLNASLLRKVCFYLLICLLLAMLVKQSPLYWENQNTKFLHGMAWAGVGNLKNDWLAQTRDGLPMFSGLIFTIYAYSSPFFVYIIYILLLGIFFFSLKGILCTTFEIHPDSPKYILLCGSIVLIISRYHTIYDGVAVQYLFSGYLQPCTFGVFIILSIHLFLKRQEVLASACLTLACLMHPAYLFVATLLISISAVEVFCEKRDWRAMLLILGPFILCGAGYLLYLSIEFRPTSAQYFDRALQILVVERIPHHTLLAIWSTSSIYTKLALVLLSLFLLRGRPLLRILSWLVFATLIFTLLQAVTHSSALALLAPWRASVVIMPLAVFSVIAWVIQGLPDQLGQELQARKKVVLSIFSLIFVILAVHAGRSNYKRFRKYATGPEMLLLRHIAAHKGPSDIYLIPNHDDAFDKFRLETGAPAFVNWKSHPYKDSEVLDWYQRNRLVDQLYSASIQALPGMLNALRGRYHVTHLIASKHSEFATCPLLKPEYFDSSFVLYRIEPTMR